jgi:transcriptional regulator with XRE-family HTH domain
MTTFELIKELAKKQGLSLAQLNDKAGLGKNSIYHWRTKTPSTDSLQKVADVLHVSVDYLLGNTDDPSPNSPNFPDLSDDHIFMYQGHPIPEEDMETIRAILDRYAAKKKGDK